MAQESWQQVRDIFVDVVRQEPEVRPALLEQACGGNSDVRREVESLLSSYDCAGSFMESPAVVEVAESFDAGFPQLESGQTLGHYKIIKQIGKGGMGEVYLAKDTILDRKVAVKILSERFSQHESNLQRFIHEAKAASSLNHPNILIIHEIGTTENARYIVSEYVEGRTLREYAKDRALKLSEVLGFSIQIAGALSAAHAAHLVHRDIKPENVMIRPDGIVKILDFGLAKLIEQENKSSVNLEAATRKQNQTAKGVILGTVNYMSPEQAKGGKVDERTDTFSFGVVLFEMITGSHPFRGSSTNEIFAAILQSEPSPLDSRVSDVPKEMERIVSKTLRKNPNERYRNIGDLLIDLEDLEQELEFEAKLERSVQPNLKKVENETTALNNRDSTGQVGTTAGQNISGTRYITNGLKRHKFVSFFGLATLVIALAASGYFTFFAEVNNQIESIAVMPFVNETGDPEVEYLSDGMTETLISSLSKIPNLSVKARSSVFLYKGKAFDPKKIGEELNVQAVLLGRIVQQGEDLSLNLELVDTRTENVLWAEKFDRKMNDLVFLQSEIAKQVAGKITSKLSGNEREKVTQTHTKNPQAYEAYLKGRYYWNQRIEESLIKGIAYFRQAIEIDPNYALAWSGLADSYVVLPAFGDYPPREYIPKARQAAQKAIKLDPDLAEAQTSLAYIECTYDRRFTEAEERYRKAIELNPNYATAYQWYAELLLHQGRFNEAKSKAKMAVELDPLSLIKNQVYATTFFYGKQFPEAEKYYRKTLELKPDFPNVNNRLAHALAAQNKIEEALGECDKANESGGESYKFCEGNVYAFAGDRKNAKRFLADYAGLNPKQIHAMATIYALLGEDLKAIEGIELLIEQRSEFALYVNTDPGFEKIRENPSFKILMKRIGLTEQMR